MNTIGEAMMGSTGRWLVALALTGVTLSGCGGSQLKPNEQREYDALEKEQASIKKRYFPTGLVKHKRKEEHKDDCSSCSSLFEVVVQEPCCPDME